MRCALLILAVFSAPQPVAQAVADTALVDAIMAASETSADVGEALHELLSSAPGDAAGERDLESAFRAAWRDILFDRYDADAYRDVLTHLTGAGHGAIEAHRASIGQRYPTPEALEARVAEAASGRVDGLASETLARRFLDMDLPILRPTEAMVALKVAMHERDPAAAELLAEAGAFELPAPSELTAAERAGRILATRLFLAGLDPGVVEAEIGFRESDVGSGHFASIRDAALHALIPHLATQLVGLVRNPPPPPPPPIAERAWTGYIRPVRPAASALSPESLDLAYDTELGGRLWLLVRDRTDPAWVSEFGGEIVLRLAEQLDARLSPAELAEAMAFFRSETFAQIWLAEQRSYLMSPDDRSDALDRSAGASRSASPGRAEAVRALLLAQARDGIRAERYRRAFEIVSRELPDAAAEMKASGWRAGVLEQAEDPPGVTDAYVDYVVVELDDVPVPTLREGAAFYASPVGQLVVDALMEAALQSIIPWQANSLVARYAESTDEVFDVVERNPVLVGGLIGLQSRVEYPRAAREAGIEGRVFVQFVVNETGAVVDPIVTRSPSELLSEAALRAVRESRFVPGSQDGRPVKVRFSLPINFVLNDIDIVDVPDLPARVIGGLDAVQDALAAPEDAPRGTVFVRVVLDPAGAVTNVRVERSPDPSLDQAALDAVLAVEYAPAEHRGGAVHTALMVPVRFGSSPPDEAGTERR